jgi:8-oxo-dGTP diphosphatase
MTSPGPPRFDHCPRCGGRLAHRPHGDRDRPVCDGCGAVTYHNPAVGVAIIVRDATGAVLLGRRAGSYGGMWCIPCGYVEWDEDVREAAAREFHEETGLEVAVGDVVAVHSNFHNPAQHTVGIWFAGRVTGGELCAGDDLDQVGFYPPDQPPGPLAFPTDEIVLADLHARDALAEHPTT